MNEHVLNRNGWQIDCQSPLEISNATGDTATGEAAWIVYNYLSQHSDEGFEEYENECESEEEEDWWDPDNEDEDLD